MGNCRRNGRTYNPMNDGCTFSEPFFIVQCAIWGILLPRRHRREGTMSKKECALCG